MSEDARVVVVSDSGYPTLSRKLIRDAVKCPYCKAKHGYACVDEQGKERVRNHHSRMAAAQRAWFDNQQEGESS